MSDIDVKSSGSAVDGDRAKKQRERLDAIRVRKERADAKAAAAKTSGAAAKKAAGKTSRSSASKNKAASKADAGGDVLAGIAGVAASAVANNADDLLELGEQVLSGAASGVFSGSGGNDDGGSSGAGGSSAPGGRRAGLPSTNILLIVLIVAVLAVGAIVLWPRISGYLGLSGTTVAADLSEDEVMGTAAVDFNNAILQQSRQEQQLVVWEQDAQVDTQISSEFLGMGVFRKAKEIHSRGTGVYAVDLSQVEDDDVAVDEASRTVTVFVPRPHLRYITKDLKDTVFESTDHAILGFGELKLTQEQQNIVERSIEDAMRAELTKKAQYQKADEAALLMAYDVYEPVCKKVSDGYRVKVEFAKGSTHADDSADVNKSDTQV